MRYPLFVALALLVWAGLALGAVPGDPFEVRVLSAVDGDTVDVRVMDPPEGVWLRERVRLLGFDAPEIGEPYAAEATRLVRELARSGRTWLELDRQLRDPYDRLLAHLWVEIDEDWLLVGEEVLRAGLARTLFIPPNDSYWDRLRRAELEAQVRGAGIWGVFAEPLSLRELEGDPVRYVTKVVSVRMTIGEIQATTAGVVLHAVGSGMGFHAVVDEPVWDALEGQLKAAVGTRIDVRGELDWRRLADGPFIRVEWAEQIELVDEWPRGGFIHGPYTGAPDGAGVTVSWTAEPPLPGRVEYGLWEEYVATQELPLSVAYNPDAAEGRATAHVRLHALDPSSRYAYRVVLGTEDEEESSPVGTFHTAPHAGEPLAFAVIADTQWQWDGVNRIQLVGDALASDPSELHFILHGGDLVESPIPRFWDHMFFSLSDALLRAPFLPVLGNHERNSRTYYELFTLPPGGGLMDKRWWALEYGDVVVIGLDTNVNRPGDYTAQVEFLREQLSGEHAHRFVIFHHPVFTSDAIYGPGSDGLQLLFHPVFTEMGVNIVFTGHAHNYERIERDGVTYLVVGGGGATLRPLAAERVDGSQFSCDEHYFYVRVFTDPEGIRVEAVKVARQLNGEVVPASGILDAFTLPSD